MKPLTQADWHTKLDTMLAEIDAPWLAYLIETFRERATAQHTRWSDYLAADEPKENSRYVGGRRVTDRRSPTNYGLVSLNADLTEAGFIYDRLRYRNDAERHLTGDRRVVGKKDGYGSFEDGTVLRATGAHFYADMNKADRAAEAHYQNARFDFLMRNSTKLAAATEGRAPTNITMKATWDSGTVEGSMEVIFGDDVLRTRTRIKHNWSVLGNPYLQYPTIFWLNETSYGLDWLAANFADTSARARVIPQTVDAKLLKTAGDLTERLANVDAHTEAERTRDARAWRRSPRTNASYTASAIKKLGVPADITAAEAAGLLLRSLGHTLTMRLAELALGTVGEERAPLGNKGKARRDLNKVLEKAGLVYRSDRVKLSRAGRAVADTVDAMTVAATLAS